MALVLVPLLLACAPAQPTPAASMLVPGQRATVEPFPRTPPASAAPTAPVGSAGVPIARATFTSPFTPTPAPDVPSPALGLTRAAFEARNPPSAAGTIPFLGGRPLRVTYLDGRVASLEIDNPIDFETARAANRDFLLPTDAVYLRTERAPDDAVVDVFRSPSLATRFPSARWREPGGFAVVYHLGSTFPGGTWVTSYRVVLGEP